MEEIQFSNQENQVNFVPEAPKIASVSQAPPAKGGKILPWAAGIGLALVAGAISYKVYLNRQEVASETQTRTQAVRETPVQDQDVVQLSQSELENLKIAPERARAGDYESGGQPSAAAATVPTGAINLDTANTTKGGLVVKKVAAAQPETVVTKKVVKTTVKSGRVSGTVTVNGNIPSGSSILVLYRLPGVNDFTAGPRLEAKSGVSWSLNLAAGTTYEIKLVWQVNNDNYLAGETKTIVAPAKLSTTFNFIQTSTNSGGSGEKPWLPILDTCGNYNDNAWTARILLPQTKDNLVAYHVMIGTSQGKDDVRVETFNHTERFFFDQKLDNDKDYYVRYQIKTSDGKWSDWSNSLKIKCRRS